VNRSASRCQFPTSDMGQTSSVGPVRGGAPGTPCAARSWSSNASVCTLLPSPMSSARMPPRPRSLRKDSQARPRSWYGRRSPRNEEGALTGVSERSPAPESRSPSHPSAATAVTLEIFLRAAQPGHQDVTGPHHALAAALHELQRGAEVAFVQLHPLPPDPDQGDLQLGQFG